MSVRRGVARGAATLGLGQAAAQGLSMVKNVVMARLLGPTEWGIVATFWVALTLLDAVSTLAADRQVVQARDGGEEMFLGTAHVLQAARGVGTGIVVFGLSWVAAWAFDTREALWAYQLIALVPALRGLAHLGIFVQQREMRFGSTIWVELGTQAFALALGCVLAWQFRSYAAALWMILGQTLVSCLLSHVFGGKRYRWSWDRAAAARMWRFGLPLMANGVLLFVILQGDQGVIGMTYDKATLGQYAAAFGLASIPTMLVAKVASTVFLPPLAKAQGDREAFNRRVGASVEALALVTGCVGVGMALLGPWVVTIAYGDAYVGAAGVIGLLGVMFAIRLFRTIHTLAAMARNDTMNALFANCWRSAALVAVVVIAIGGGDPLYIASAGVAGECVALVASTVRLARRQRVPMGLTIRPAMVLGVVVAGAYLLREVSIIARSVGLQTLLAGGLVVFMGTAMWIVSPRIRQELAAVIRTVQRTKVST